MKINVYSTMLLIVVAGCEVPELEPPQAAAPAQPAATAATPGDTSAAAPADTTAAAAPPAAEPSAYDRAAHVDPEAFLPDGRVDMSGVEGEPPMTSGVPREIHPKDPKQGKLSRRAGGTLGTTMQSMPWVKNETTFNLVIKPALLQYEIIHSHYPKDHKEFMEKFIPEMCPQVLPLPELEPGDEYLYDPDDHLLKIWRPAEATPELRAKYLGEDAAASSANPEAQPAAGDQSAAPTSANPGSPNPNEPPAVTSTPRELTGLDPAKGKKSRAAGGYLGAVAGARFYAEHSMIFNNMKHSLDLFNASEGRYPNSHEEFMTAIIQANQIALPELDPGVEYIYDPEDHKLKIWQPEDTETAPVAIEEES
jgi:hypothetical protein